MKQHIGQVVWTASALLGAFTVISAAQGATITENFNDYGTTSTFVSGLGTAGDGWAGAWTELTTDSGWPQYEAGSSLTFNSPNYTTAANQTGANDGLIVTGATNTNASKAAYRSFSTPLTGTIWISALTQFHNVGPDVLLILDATSGTNNYVGIRLNATLSKAEARIKTNGTEDADEFGPGGTDNVYPNDTSLLLLSRIQIDIDASGNDQIDYWIFDSNSTTTGIPALPATAAGLPATPSFSKVGDFYGTSLSAIGVAVTKANTKVDAIRISNDANGFEQVTSVPEPGLLGAGLLGLLALRRRR
jgi:MYXO-CTERM domain-containing protein